ncbi:hypothetical protein ACMU_13600 [Actibacterium mucosum KCTC 23349]|uniref:Uncharacterized protein n=1 Tax=Actibacterium mucosum KCTC 23349 TaxID=1454373 RepID=A0A037ZLJ6_9RHOB|nr:hypothetical protein [Actibacterium mucosum]KAJ55716.1 hypothetical protein ACMU_13600 [Actibacterium mucosum KCTC 23349]
MAATGAAAETLKCERSRLSTSGFGSRSAAESWFPTSSVFIIEGDKVRSDYYGEGTVKDTGNRVKMTFGVESSGGDIVRVGVTLVKKNGKYTASILPKGNYQQVVGAGGKCISG